MDKEIKKKMLYAVCNHLKDRGCENVKTNLFHTENPRKIVGKLLGDIFELDMTATHNDNAFIFELEMGASIDTYKERFIKKCNVFQQYASEHCGK